MHLRKPESHALIVLHEQTLKDLITITSQCVGLTLGFSTAPPRHGTMHHST